MWKIVGHSGCDHTPWVSSAQCVARLHIEWKLKKKQTEFISVRVFLLCSVSTRCKCCKVCDTKATRSADKRLLLSSMLCFNGRMVLSHRPSETYRSLVLEVALPARYVFFFFDSWTWPSSRGMITRFVCLTARIGSLPKCTMSEKIHSRSMQESFSGPGVAMPDKTHTDHLNSVMETKLAKQKIIRKITSSGDPLSGASRPSSNSVCPNTRWSWRVLPWDATGALYRELFDQHMSSELPWVLGTCRDTHLRSPGCERLC